MRFAEVREKIQGLEQRLAVFRRCSTCGGEKSPLLICGDGKVRCVECFWRENLIDGGHGLVVIGEEGVELMRTTACLMRAAGERRAEALGVEFEVKALPPGVTEEEQLAAEGKLVEVAAEVQPEGWTEDDLKQAEAGGGAGIGTGLFGRGWALA